MCGRFALTSLLSECQGPFQVRGPLPRYSPRYNIAPSQAIPVLRPVLRPAHPQRPPAASELEPPLVDIVLMRWGLIPHWSKGPDPRYSMINARAESVHERPAYAQAFRHRRALVPANGYYEWQAPPGGRGRKQPFLISRPHMALFYMAAVWDSWSPPAGEEVLSVSLMTTAATDSLRPIHDRMPVIIPIADAGTWFDPAASADTLAALMRPLADDLEFHAVGTAVNNAGHDAPDCIQPL